MEKKILMKKILSFILFLSSFVYAQIFTTNFGEYKAGEGASTLLPSWAKNYHNGLLWGIGKLDSNSYKGHRYLEITTQNTWRGNIFWKYQLPSVDIPTTLAPQLYSEFFFYQNGVMNTTYGYCFKNNVRADSMSMLRGYVIEAVDRTTGNDSIRVIKYINNKGTVIASAALSFTFLHRFSNGIPNSMYCLKARMVNDTIRAKIWQRAGTEPATWNIICYDNTYTDVSGRAAEITTSGWSVYIDSLSVTTTPPINYTLNLISPVSNQYSAGNRVNDYNISWTKSSNVDTVGVYINDVLIGSTSDTVFTISQDSLKSYGHGEVADTFKVSIKAITRKIDSITLNTPLSVAPEISSTITESGTKTDPYIIYSAEQYVEYISHPEYPLWKHIKLGNNFCFLR